MLIEVRCKNCKKLHCKVSKDYSGVIIFTCYRCDKPNTLSLSMILKQVQPDKLHSPTQVSTRA